MAACGINVSLGLILANLKIPRNSMIEFACGHGSPLISRGTFTTTEVHVHAGSGILAFLVASCCHICIKEPELERGPRFRVSRIGTKQCERVAQFDKCLESRCLMKMIPIRLAEY